MTSTPPAEPHELLVQQLSERLGLPAPLPHLSQALTHPSFANEQKGSGQVDNQRLEFLGDAVLSLCVSEALMASFAAVDEGALTVMRASLVNARALASFAREVRLGEALRLGRGADAAGERRRTNVLADTVEAVIGAVYLDAGLEAARQLSHTVVAARLQRLVAQGGMERDPKSRLQELVQAQGLEPPTYEVIDVTGPPHDRAFTVQVQVRMPGGDPGGAPPVAGSGAGRSKKLAEQAAARAALAVLEDGPDEPPPPACAVVKPAGGGPDAAKPPGSAETA